LDADSSQHSAIIDVLNGKNIVIEGPPGTGKSQTITNLIAACLANGKSVLFVAEKLTALEVVRKRLDASGLGAFCLELHSHKTQKKTVLADIKNRLDINTDACRHSLKDVETQLQELDRKKKNLIEYDNVINTPFANIPETPHEIYGKQKICVGI
jgi:archaellum biogenesis ATPase FlaH